MHRWLVAAWRASTSQRESFVNTTQQRSRVDYHVIAQGFTQEFLSSRAEAGLPKAANGLPIAPSNPRAAQIRKDIHAGKAHPFEHITIVAATDILDGVPFHRATSAIRLALAFLERVEQERASGRPLVRGFSALVQREERVHAAAVVAALRALEAPADANALRSVVHNCDTASDALCRVRSVAERELVDLSASSLSHQQARPQARRLA